MARPIPRMGQPQYRAADIEVQDGRTICFVASDETVDRYGDIIRADGWDLTNFRRNPVLLFGHDSRSLPIGTANVWIAGKQLLADATFLRDGVSDFADEVWRVVEAGALRAVSVGFLPTAEPNVLRDEKKEFITGFEFIGQELLELSVVPVPANPQAIALARALAGREQATMAHRAATARRRRLALLRLGP